MNARRKSFKKTLKSCRKNESQRINDKIAMSFAEKSFKKFWTHVKSQDKGNYESLPDKMDSVTGEKNICEHWGKVYGNLFNSNQSSDKFESVNDYIKNECNNNNAKLLNVEQMLALIRQLKCNKAAGSDDLQSEHFKKAGGILIHPLISIVNSIICHQYVPAELMKVLIVPILKKKGLDPTCSSNYRPIALASTFSKIVELALLTLYNQHLYTSSSQFGYKKKMGTELAVYTIKQVVHHYVRHDTPVYVCYLDATKAFDRVNHFTLLWKLCERKVPSVVVGLLLYWFRTQLFSVRWGTCVSTAFPVLSSVRQGGILSAFLFAVYMDNLSESLTRTGLGCRVRNVLCNNYFYADDVCLLTTSIESLKRLLKICEEYATTHDLTFNPSKSVCQLYADYSYELTRPLIKLCGKFLQWQDTVRYLGFDMNCHNRDEEEMLRRRREMYACANQLQSRFYMCSRDVKIYLFKTYFSSIYCASVWVPVNTKLLDKLKVTYNNCFRILMGYSRRCSASTMFCENRVRNFDAMRRNLIYSLLYRIAQSDNEIIRAIICSNVFVKSSISKMWRKLLFNID